MCRVRAAVAARDASRCGQRVGGVCEGADEVFEVAAGDDDATTEGESWCHGSSWEIGGSTEEGARGGPDATRIPVVQDCTGDCTGPWCSAARQAEVVSTIEHGADVARGPLVGVMDEVGIDVERRRCVCMAEATADRSNVRAARQ